MLLNRRLAVLAASAAAAVTATVGFAVAAPAAQQNPPTSLPPQYDYEDPSRSFLVELNFGSTSATLIGASVGGQRSRSHVGDPPLLRLSLTDEDGAPAGTLNAWDPRWYFDRKPGGGESLILRNGPGTLTFPFDGDVGSLLVHDLRAGIDLATVDLRPAVHEFCLNHPSDAQCVEADLSVTSASPNGYLIGVLGEPFTLAVEPTVANLGPDGPVDADVTQTASWSPGVTVTPASHTFDVDALAVGSPTTVSGNYTITCLETGTTSLTVATSVVPEKAKVADLNPSNDSTSVTFSVECAVPVTINVMPGSLTNPVVVDPGAMPVAILTTAAGEYGNPLAFDAASIQASTVRVGVQDVVAVPGGGAPEIHGQVHLEDSRELDERTRDRDKDGVVHAQRDQLGVQPTTVEICVRGRFGPGVGTTFFGCDHITLVP